MENVDELRFYLMLGFMFGLCAGLLLSLCIIEYAKCKGRLKVVDPK